MAREARRADPARGQAGHRDVGNLSMAQTYYTAAKPYLALEHAEVIKKYLHIK